MTDDFQSIWLARLNQPGDREEAARVIFEHYSEQLLKLVQRRIADRFGPRFDEEDVLQSVFHSFFKKPFDFPDSRALRAFLIQLCLNKTSSSVRHHERDKRDVRLEQLEGDSIRGRTTTVGLGQRRATSEPVDSSLIDEQYDSFFDEAALRLMTVGATGEQAAILVEMFESLPTDLQNVLSWRLEGLTEDEIARKMEVTRRTVTRKIARIYELLSDFREDSGS